MQTEGDQQAFDDAVDRERQCRIALRRPMGKALDAGADGWPQETEHDPGRWRQGGDDGNETLASEEAQIGRQIDAVIAVEQGRRDATDQDAAEYAGIDGRMPIKSLVSEPSSLAMTPSVASSTT